MPKISPIPFARHIIFALSLIPLAVESQDNPIACRDLRSGIFHCYPKNSNVHYLYNIDGTYQHETNLNTGDTSLWLVKWIGDCSYTLKYISGNNKMNEQTAELLKRHKLAFEVEQVTPDYYIYKAFIDKTSNLPVNSDTMWMHEKVNFTDNLFIQHIPENYLRKNHFSDTSRYAVLYVYRPGKFTNSLADYPVYLNENVLCIAKNKSGYVFKISKEGLYNIKSRLYKDESAVNIEVKFGNIYYLKSMIHWGIFGRLYNFKLDLEVMKADPGKAEFEAVNVQ
jgi:hypothetical protein